MRRQQVSRNGWRVILQRQGRRFDFMSHAVDQQLAKMAMYDRAFSPARLQYRRVPTLADVFENGRRNHTSLRNGPRLVAT